MEEIEKLYHRFKNISNSIEDDDLIDQEEFMEALGLKDTIFAQRLFQLFDKDGNGSIDFKEFLMGLSVFCGTASMDDKIKFAFSIFDVDGDGQISREELFNMLKASLLENSVDIPEQQLHGLVEATFQEADENNDGFISFEEYRELVKKHPKSISFLHSVYK